MELVEKEIGRWVTTGRGVVVCLASKHCGGRRSAGCISGGGDWAMGYHVILGSMHCCLRGLPPHFADATPAPPFPPGCRLEGQLETRGVGMVFTKGALEVRIV